MSTKVYRDRRPGLIVPIFLIGLGILLLLSNLGLLSWTVWEAVFRLWPIFLIAVGLEVLIGRRSVFGSLLAVAIVFFIAMGSLWSLSVGPAITGLSVSGWDLTNREISQPLNGATQAQLNIGINVGNLRIGDLYDSTNLVEGNLALGNGESVRESRNVSGDTVYYDLHSEEVKVFPFSTNGNGDRIWQVSLNPAIPLRLNLNTGIGTSEINLAKLNVTNLTVNTGVGKTTLTLPSQGKVQADISGGVGDTTVIIPQGVAARITVESGVGNMSVSGNYQQRNSTYTSPDYDSAQNRIDANIKGGIGKITIVGSN